MYTCSYYSTIVELYLYFPAFLYFNPAIFQQSNLENLTYLGIGKIPVSVKTANYRKLPHTTAANYSLLPQTIGGPSRGGAGTEVREFFTQYLKPRVLHILDIHVHVSNLVSHNIDKLLNLMKPWPFSTIVCISFVIFKMNVNFSKQSRQRLFYNLVSQLFLTVC